MSLFRRVLLTLWPKRREDAPAVEIVAPETPVTSSDASLEWSLPYRQPHYNLDARRMAFSVPGNPIGYEVPGKQLAFSLESRRLDFILEVVT